MESEVMGRTKWRNEVQITQLFARSDVEEGWDGVSPVPACDVDRSVVLWRALQIVVPCQVREARPNQCMASWQGRIQIRWLEVCLRDSIPLVPASHWVW